MYIQKLGTTHVRHQRRYHGSPYEILKKGYFSKVISAWSVYQYQDYEETINRAPLIWQGSLDMVYGVRIPTKTASNMGNHAVDFMCVYVCGHAK